MSLNKKFLLALSLTTAVTMGCESEEKKQISFTNDVTPILKANCLSCHVAGAAGQQKSGLLMDTYDNLIKGTQYGPVIVPGDSLTSVFNQVVEGRVDKSISMPHGGKNLSQYEINILKTWVDQGAKNN